MRTKQFVNCVKANKYAKAKEALGECLESKIKTRFTTILKKQDKGNN